MYPVSCGQAAIKGRSYTVLHWRDWYDRLTAVTVPQLSLKGNGVTLKTLTAWKNGGLH